MEDIGQRIAVAREAKRLAQIELAKMLGVTAQAVQQWEAGKTSPRGHRLRDVAAALDVTVEHLLYGDGSSLASVSVVRKFVPKPDANVEPGPDLRGHVPLISWVQAATLSVRTKLPRATRQSQSAKAGGVASCSRLLIPFRHLARSRPENRPTVQGASPSTSGMSGNSFGSMPTKYSQVDL